MKKLPIFIWECRLNGTAFPYFILLKTLPWGINFPFDISPTGFLPVRIS